ncbi:MAG: phosphatidylglycerophosphatase A [Ignavibacteriae bacterium]|nr:phosphatidylglycerophosphatase A [Ignavibacteriota bacterium]MCB9206872.1 phosphatidylglycerophosphatase A [Ignavibacteriales bacterium]MCB9209781.1 phosphatidylglycerophosphatase A [Ignavibacteriales bacterium]MCB9218937.1 phosphatidylglycerophosphatase A [Ignavibacteriales bacterium]
MKQIKKLIGSGFYTGYFPFASGTIGSLLALLIYLIPGFEKAEIIIPIIIISFVIGVFLGNYFEIEYGKDPKQFTLDEFVGTWISLLFLPKSIIIITVTFIIWRILDITKPYPANISEKLNGGLGIMLDDVISGMYSLLIMHIFNFLFF